MPRFGPTILAALDKRNKSIYAIISKLNGKERAKAINEQAAKHQMSRQMVYNILKKCSADNTNNDSER